jgi:zinc protease
MHQIKINKFTLSNGLRVLHVEDKTTSMVAVNTLYDVGAKDEQPNKTGLAHLMEHLMFGGSINVPEFDTVMQNAGGENNAWTSNDETNFYDILPANNIETALYLESDRMKSLSFSPESLNVQRNVVCEEFKQRNLNRPYGDLAELIRGLTFEKHPYQWLTIGRELSQIEKMSLDDVMDFFFSHYAPNNAILSIVGNITLEKTKILTEKWYGDISPRKVPIRHITPEPQQTKSRLLKVTRDVPNNVIYKAWHVPSIKTSDYYVTDVITDILAYGKSSRMPQNLIEKNHKFNQLDAYVGSLTDEGLIYVKGTMEDGVTFEEADLLIQKELDKLKESPIGEREMQKIRNCYEADKLYPSSIETVASDIAGFEMLRDANDYQTQVERHNAVTPEQVSLMARQLLNENNCSTLYYSKRQQA